MARSKNKYTRFENEYWKNNNPMDTPIWKMLEAWDIENKKNGIFSESDIEDEYDKGHNIGYRDGLKQFKQQNMITDIFTRVLGYNKTERIQRVIEIAVKEDQASPMELMEMSLIQEIRDINGELDEVRKQREQE